MEVNIINGLCWIDERKDLKKVEYRRKDVSREKTGRKVKARGESNFIGLSVL